MLSCRHVNNTGLKLQSRCRSALGDRRYQLYDRTNISSNERLLNERAHDPHSSCRVLLEQRAQNVEVRRSERNEEWCEHVR